MIKEAGMAKIMAAGRVLGIGKRNLKSPKGLEESQGSVKLASLQGNEFFSLLMGRHWILIPIWSAMKVLL